jgi:hypothetical protein
VDTADDLAAEAGRIELSFAGDDEIRAGEVVVEVEFVRHQFEPREQRRAERGERAAESAGGTTTFDLADIGLELVEEHLREPVEAAPEHLHLCGRRSFLRPVDVGRVEEHRRDVARREQFDVAEAGDGVDRPDRSVAAVGRRRSAEADNDPAGTGVERMSDQLAGTGGRRGHRVVLFGAAEQRQAARPRHLDHRGPPGHAPRRGDGIAERPGHRRGAIGPSEHVEEPVAAVGHRHLDALDAEFPAGVADRLGHFAGRERALELVGGRDDSGEGSCVGAAYRHGRTVVLYPPGPDAVTDGRQSRPRR